MTKSIIVDGIEFVPKEKEEYPIVPKNIQICKGTENLYFRISDNQALSILKEIENWVIISWNDLDELEASKRDFRLVSCERSELKAGELAFRSDIKEPDFSVAVDYCFVLDAEKYVFVYTNDSIDELDINEEHKSYFFWWRVEKVKV